MIHRNKKFISIKIIRQAIADYMSSEGCSCCESSNHNEHGKILGTLLNVKKYKDGSGYDFYKYKTKKKGGE